MQTLLPDDYNAYSDKYMKIQLQEHFGQQHIRFVRNKGLVVLSSMQDSIVEQFHQSKRVADPEQEKLRLVIAAGNLIHEEIRCHEKGLVSVSEYPSLRDLDPERMSAELPIALRVLLSRILRNKTHRQLRIASIGQSIAQVSRPKTLQMKIPLALAIQLHHSHASRQLNETMWRLGYAESYTTVQHFERDAAILSNSSDATPVQEDPPQCLRQYIADNVDWNSATIDGKGSIHVQGMMGAVTPSLHTTYHKIKKSHPTNQQLKELIDKNIKYLSSSEIKQSSYLGKLKFAKLSHPKALLHNVYRQVDLLYHCAPRFNYSAYLWSGTMALVFSNKEYSAGKSSFEFLPMINMKSTDMNCIYSTLLFIENHARKHGATAVVTFDQPLFHKALQLVTAEGSPFKLIILRLGGFHTIMCYLATIGDTMENTGITETMSVAYAEGAVPQMLNGKSYSRAMRSHTIIAKALMTLLLQDKVESEMDEEDVALLKGIFEDLLKEDSTVDDLADDDKSKRVLKLLDDKYKEAVREQQSSKTSLLWLQYLDMLNIMFNYLR